MSTAVKMQVEVTATITYLVEVDADSEDGAQYDATTLVMDFIEYPPDGLSLTGMRQGDDGAWTGGAEYTADVPRTYES